MEKVNLLKSISKWLEEAQIDAGIKTIEEAYEVLEDELKGCSNDYVNAKAN